MTTTRSRARVLIPVLVLAAIGIVAWIAFEFTRKDESGTVADPARPAPAAAAAATDAVAPPPTPTTPTRATVEGETQKPKQRVTGKVMKRTERGLEPLAGGTVVLRSRPPELQLRPALARMPQWEGAKTSGPEATLRADGSFVLEGETLAGFLHVADPLLACETTLRIDGSEDSLPPLIVYDAGCVKGRIVDANGHGVGGVKFSLSETFDMSANLSTVFVTGAKRTNVTGTSGDDGAFEVPAVPSGVSFSVKADDDRYPPAEASVTVAAGETASVELRLEPGAFLAGRVVGGGKPVAGAKVSARSTKVSLDPTTPGPQAKVERSTTTAADGTFRFDGMQLGKVRLEVHCAEFAPGHVPAFALTAPGLQMPQDIVLDDGPRIRGRVVDDAGAPVAGARIGIVKPIPFVGSEMIFSPEAAEEAGGVSTKADADGRFESPPLPSGAQFDVVVHSDAHAIGSAKAVKPGANDVVVKLERFGGVSGIVEDALDGEPITRFMITVASADAPSMFGVPNATNPQPLLLVRNDDGAFAFDRLKPGSYRIEVDAQGFARGASTTFGVEPGKTTAGLLVRLMHEASISGVVVDSATGNPVAAAHVGLAHTGMFSFDPLAMNHTALTDHAGKFRLGGLSAGSMSLSAVAKGFAATSSGSIALAEGETREGVQIRLARGAVVRGFVGSKDGKPETGSIVTCQQIGTFVPSTTTVDEKGNYEVTGLTAGSYSVTKLGGMLDDSSDNPFDSLFAKMATKSVRLAEGEEKQLDFIAGEAGGSALTGKVTEAGEPVGGAFLTFTPDEAEAGASAIGALRVVSTKDDGSFRAEGLAPGDWSVTVQSGASLSNTARQSFDFTVSNLPETRHDFELSATGLEGLVRSKDGKKPLSGVRVKIDATDAKVKLDAFVDATGSNRVADLFTDDGGHFVARGLAAGKYRVTAGGPGFFGLGGTGYAASDPVDVTVTDGARTRGVDFDLEPGGAVAGTVRDPKGQPVAGASIFVVGTNDTVEPFAQVMTEATGAFKVSGLSQGPHIVIARASGFAPAIEHGVHVRANEEAPVSMTVTEGASVTVTALDSGGAAVAGARVTLVDASGIALNKYLGLDEIMKAVSGGATTAHDLGPLAAGTYTIIVEKHGSKAETTVQHGNSAQTVTVQLP